MGKQHCTSPVLWKNTWCWLWVCSWKSASVHMLNNIDRNPRHYSVFLSASTNRTKLSGHVFILKSSHLHQDFSASTLPWKPELSKPRQSEKAEVTPLLWCRRGVWQLLLEGAFTVTGKMCLAIHPHFQLDNDKVVHSAHTHGYFGGVSKTHSEGWLWVHR